MLLSVWEPLNLCHEHWVSSVKRICPVGTEECVWHHIYSLYSRNSEIIRNPPLTVFDALITCGYAEIALPEDRSLPTTNWSRIFSGIGEFRSRLYDIIFPSANMSSCFLAIGILIIQKIIYKKFFKYEAWTEVIIRYRRHTGRLWEKTAPSNILSPSPWLQPKYETPPV